MPDDYASNPQTTGTVAVGTPVTGEIQRNFDRDWTEEKSMHLLTIRTIGSLLIAGVLVTNLSHAIASEPKRFMGDSTAQRIFDSGSQNCWKRAYNKSNYYENVRVYNMEYAGCIDRLMSDYDKRSRAFYAVIVYSYEPDEHHTLAWNDKTLTSAMLRAQESCEDHGNRNCIIRHFTRNGCISFATGDYDHGFGSASTESQARRIALDHCADDSSCMIKLTRCTK